MWMKIGVTQKPEQNQAQMGAVAVMPIDDPHISDRHFIPPSKESSFKLL